MLKINTLIAVSLFGLSACGGSSSSSFEKPTIVDGVFKDSNVSGLFFVSDDETGVTDKNGAFTYVKGKKVTFSIGGVGLGSGLGQPVMTPLDLVENGSLVSPEVANKVRFLMMLDKDNTPSNGIEISPKVQLKAKEWKTVDFKDGVFPSEAVHSMITNASVEDGVSHVLPDSDAAITHLKTTLLCANAGAYGGTYTGGESGNIVLMVNPVTGEVNGSSYNPDNKVSVEVKSISALDYDKGLKFTSAEDSAKSFAGTLNSTTELSGTWSNVADVLRKGDFTATRIGGESDAVYRYTVTFSGSDKGLYVFDVDKGNKVTGTSYSVSTQKESKLSGKIKNNELTVTSADGDKLTAFIEEDTLVVNTGVWINGTKKSAGTFEGSGCKLN